MYWHIIDTKTYCILLYCSVTCGVIAALAKKQPAICWGLSQCQEASFADFLFATCNGWSRGSYSMGTGSSCWCCENMGFCLGRLFCCQWISWIDIININDLYHILIYQCRSISSISTPTQKQQKSHHYKLNHSHNHNHNPSHNHHEDITAAKNYGRWLIQRSPAVATPLMLGWDSAHADKWWQVLLQHTCCLETTTLRICL